MVVWLHVKHRVHQEVARGENHCARRGRDETLSFGRVVLLNVLASNENYEPGEK